MGKGTLYVDLASQPCRTIVLLIQACKLDVELKTTSILDGEHTTEKFKKMNPFCRLPTYAEDGFVLTESVAIARYLVTANKVPDHWYPADPKKRGRVDEFMAWHHTGLRSPAMAVFKPVVFGKMQTGNVDLQALKPEVANLEKALTDLENVFLKGDFIAGPNISIADLFGMNEVTQLIATGYNVYTHHPKIGNWIDRVKKGTQPHVVEAHKRITGFCEKFKIDYEPLIAK